MIAVRASRYLSVLVGMLIAFSMGGAASAVGAPAPGWLISTTAQPAVFPAGYVSPEESGYRITVENIGGASSNPATSVKVVDTLPAGLEASAAHPPTIQLLAGVNSSSGRELCAVAGNVVTCSVPSIPNEASVRVTLPVDVVGAVSGETVTNQVNVSGGGAAPAIATNATEISASAPPFGFLPGLGGLSMDATTASGTAAVSAGSHPAAVFLRANFPTYAAGPLTIESAGALRNLAFSLPQGLVLDPRATSVLCTEKQLNSTIGSSPGSPACPPASQVGSISVESTFPVPNSPLYLMQPPPGVPAELGSNIGTTGVVVHVMGGLDGSFHLVGSSRDILAKATLPIQGVRVKLWGDPSDPRHNSFRGGLGCGAEGCSVEPSSVPLLTMPSACSSPLSLTGYATDWEEAEGSPPHEQSALLSGPDGNPISIVGCESLQFAPSITMETTSHTAGTPTGLSVHLHLPQNTGTSTLATATLKKVVVALPTGMAVNSSAANGLGACSPAQIGIGNNDAPTCPQSSKVGTVTVTTPLLKSPLSGSIYLAEQSNNPFGTLLALYLVAEGEGIVVKLPGRVDANHTTGQITATFDNNPELPFEDLNVQFYPGPRATLVMPNVCGTYSSRVELTSWSKAEPVVSNLPIPVSEGCSYGFAPKLEAGTANPTGGIYSPFTLRVTRSDGEQNISVISTTLPEGLLAKLAGVSLCPEAATVTASCPADSQVGRTVAGVGSGAEPLYIPELGKSPTSIYLAGPYKGGPYSLVFRVPAQAGPFDLGTVAIRVALQVNPESAQVTAESDPLPQILEGIPITYRDLRVNLDRADFTLNPTNCNGKDVVATLTSVTGSIATTADHFQAASCERLAFKPKIAIQLRGPKTRGKDPALRAVLTQPEGEANISRVAVTLPKSLFIDQRHVNNPCTRVQFNAGNGNGAECPSSSILGHATAYTPLLEAPLRGPVYFRSNGGERKLPDLVASLDGRVHLNVVGFVDSVQSKGGEGSRIRNIFASVPDAPVTKFILTLNAGKRSILQNSQNLCKAPGLAAVRATGQNGKILGSSSKVVVRCPAKRKKK